MNDFRKGDRVRVKDGDFAGMKGEVSKILDAHGLVCVIIRIFDHDVPVELEPRQIEPV